MYHDVTFSPMCWPQLSSVCVFLHCRVCLIHLPFLLLLLLLQLVDVSPANSRSHGTQHGAVERSNDLKPGSDGFRPLDATVVEVRVRGCCKVALSGV